MAFPSKYSGHCSRCSKHFPAGTLIRWSRKEKGKAYHDNCFAYQGLQLPPIQIPETTEEPTDGYVYTPPVPHDMTNLLPDTKEAAKPMSESILNIDALAALLKGKIQADLPVIDAEAIRKLISEELAKHATVTVTVTKQDVPDVKIENAHEQLASLIKLAVGRRNVYLYGPAGSGKSTGAKQVAEALGLDYGYISLNPMTPDSRLQGFIDANGVYRDPVFRRIYEHGGVFCIDECDNASGALLTTLNTALENHHGSFPDGIVKRHADFILIATGNTAGLGANPAYPERRPFDSAFRDRFVYLKWDYDTKLERKLALALNPKATEWVNWVQRVRVWGGKNLPRLLVSPRASIVGADLLLTFPAVAHVAEMVIFRGIDQDSVSKVLAANPYPEQG
jgi:dynein-related subfamily AAA family protein